MANDRTANAKRLREIAEELEEMALGYLKKGAQLHHEAARNRAMAVVIEESSGTGGDEQMERRE